MCVSKAMKNESQERAAEHSGNELHEGQGGSVTRVAEGITRAKKKKQFAIATLIWWGCGVGMEMEMEMVVIGMADGDGDGERRGALSAGDLAGVHK